MKELKPNILILMTDQQRYDSLSCYGCGAVRTPNLDRLAAEGVLFENCYVNNPLCAPSRASLFTGKTLPGHGEYSLRDILPDDQILMSKWLKNKGYVTALFGKLHVSADENVREHPQHGFDIYERFEDPRSIPRGIVSSYSLWLERNYPEAYMRIAADKRGVNPISEEAHYTRWITERTMDFIRKRDRKKPFFCFASTVDPHNPYTNHPESFINAVDAEKIPEPAAMVEHTDLTYITEQIRDGNVQNDRYGQDIRKLRQGYLASIVHIDHEYGKIIDTLEKEGILDDTIIVFISDHGDMLGDHGLFVKGGFFYEACVKVPFMMRYPGKIRPGTRVKHFVQPHDITSTLLSEAGYREDELNAIMPESLNLIPYISGEKDWKYFRDYAVCAYRNSGTKGQEIMLERYVRERFYKDEGKTVRNGFSPPVHATMMRYGKYKLSIYHSLNVSVADLHGELYDMEQDPDELLNLWDDQKFGAVRTEMLLRLMNWMVDSDLKKGKIQ